MALYVAIVLLAAVLALPAGDEAVEDEGIHGLALVGLVWGTTVGLALAHWFSFRIAARGFGHGILRPHDLAVAGAQVLGASAVALVCSLPALVFDDDTDIEATAVVPALLIGLAGYLAARAGSSSRVRSIVTGAVALAGGLAVATAKNVLAGH